MTAFMRSFPGFGLPAPMNRGTTSGFCGGWLGHSAAVPQLWNSGASLRWAASHPEVSSGRALTYYASRVLLVDRFVHGHDVFGGADWLDVVAGGADPAGVFVDVDALANLLHHVVDRVEG